MKNEIDINVAGSNKPIDQKIYSNFIEHIGYCIHNGIWTYDDSITDPLIKENPYFIGIRESLLDAAKEMRISVLRAFGGCYSDVYRWKEAIGLRESRKKVKNLQWSRFPYKQFLHAGPDIGNQFGTDEFCHFCEAINAEPYLNVNYSTGTPKEAAQWVEYCNGSIDTEYGTLRAKNGREKPYNVKYWGIANEIWGPQEVGREKEPENYAKRYMIFAKAMRAVDPTIKLVAVGWWRSAWNRGVMQNIDPEFIDFLSIHRYVPFSLIQLASPKRKRKSTESRYYSLLTAYKKIESDINHAWDDIVSVYGEDTHVRIAFDEWGIWYQAVRNAAKDNFNLQDGICTVDILLSFQKMTEKCSMANWAQLVNFLGSIRTDKSGICLTGVYHALKMVTNHSQNYLVEDISITCDAYDSKKYGLLKKRIDTPLLRANATIDNDSKNLSLIVINKHFSEAQQVNINLKGFTPQKQGTKLELNGASPFDYNTEDNRNRITVKETKMDSIQSTLDVVLPAHSVSIFKLTSN